MSRPSVVSAALSPRSARRLSQQQPQAGKRASADSSAPEPSSEDDSVSHSPLMKAKQPAIEPRTTRRMRLSGQGHSDADEKGGTDEQQAQGGGHEQESSESESTSSSSDEHEADDDEVHSEDMEEEQEEQDKTFGMPPGLTERQQLAYLLRVSQNNGQATAAQAQTEEKPPRPRSKDPQVKRSRTSSSGKKRSPAARRTSQKRPSYNAKKFRQPPKVWKPPQYSSWPTDKRKSWDALIADPNKFYLKYTPPGVDKNSSKSWSTAETNHFLLMLEVHPPENLWGLFSLHVYGRTGQQCEQQFKALKKKGLISKQGLPIKLPSGVSLYAAPKFDPNHADYQASPAPPPAAAVVAADPIRRAKRAHQGASSSATKPAAQPTRPPSKRKAAAPPETVQHKNKSRASKSPKPSAQSKQAQPKQPSAQRKRKASSSAQARQPRPSAAPSASASGASESTSSSSPPTSAPQPAPRKRTRIARRAKLRVRTSQPVANSTEASKAATTTAPTSERQRSQRARNKPAQGSQPASRSRARASRRSSHAVSPEDASSLSFFAQTASSRGRETAAAASSVSAAAASRSNSASARGASGASAASQLQAPRSVLCRATYHLTHLPPPSSSTHTTRPLPRISMAPQVAPPAPPSAAVQTAPHVQQSVAALVNRMQTRFSAQIQRLQEHFQTQVQTLHERYRRQNRPQPHSVVAACRQLSYARAADKSSAFQRYLPAGMSEHQLNVEVTQLQNSYNETLTELRGRQKMELDTMVALLVRQQQLLMPQAARSRHTGTQRQPASYGSAPQPTQRTVPAMAVANTTAESIPSTRPSNANAPTVRAQVPAHSPSRPLPQKPSPRQSPSVGRVAVTSSMSAVAPMPASPHYATKAPPSVPRKAPRHTAGGQSTAARPLITAQIAAQLSAQQAARHIPRPPAQVP